MTVEKRLSQEPMLELYIYETSAQVEQLEEIMVGIESKKLMEKAELERILNGLHAIKSASAMMLFPETARAAFAVESLFSLFKREIPDPLAYENVCDLGLEVLDFIRKEIRKAADRTEPEGEVTELLGRVNELTTRYGEEGIDKKPEVPGQKYYITHASYRENKTRCYSARIRFEKGCQMENIRAFTVVHNLRENCIELYHRPHDLIRDNTASEWIVRNGFQLYFSTESSETEIRLAIEDAILIEEYSLEMIDNLGAYTYDLIPSEPGNKTRGEPAFSFLPDASAASGNKEQKEQNLSEPQKTVIISSDQLQRLSYLASQIVTAESVLTQSTGDTRDISSSDADPGFQLKALAQSIKDLVGEIRNSSR